jgi:hypothetical protein
MNGKVIIAVAVFGLIVAVILAWFLYSWFEGLFPGLGWVGIAMSLALVAFIFGGIFRAMMTAKRR